MDREKVIKEYEEAVDILSKAEEPTFWMDFVRCAFENALALLKEQPEIVRCKNCKHYEDETGICDLFHTHGYAATWFCADGKRR